MMPTSVAVQFAIVPPVKTVAITVEHLRELETYSEAWKLACEAWHKWDQAKIGDEEMFCMMEDLIILHGDPNAPKPQGTINFKG